jgi:hypothetical protein
MQGLGLFAARPLPCRFQLQSVAFFVLFVLKPTLGSKFT